MWEKQKTKMNSFQLTKRVNPERQPQQAQQQPPQEGSESAYANSPVSFCNSTWIHS